jgi:hypothetical protein
VAHVEPDTTGDRLLELGGDAAGDGVEKTRGFG